MSQKWSHTHAASLHRIATWRMGGSDGGGGGDGGDGDGGGDEDGERRSTDELETSYVEYEVVDVRVYGGWGSSLLITTHIVY